MDGSFSLWPFVDVNSVFPVFLCLFVPLLISFLSLPASSILFFPALFLSCPTSSCLVSIFHLHSVSSSVAVLFIWPYPIVLISALSCIWTCLFLIYLFVCVCVCQLISLCLVHLVFYVASFYGCTLIILTFSTSNRSSWAAARLQSSSSRSLLSRPILGVTH